MDLLFLGVCLGLWAALVVMVWGLKKLESTPGGRP